MLKQKTISYRDRNNYTAYHNFGGSTLQRQLFLFFKFLVGVFTQFFFFMDSSYKCFFHGFVIHFTKVFFMDSSYSLQRFCFMDSSYTLQRFFFFMDSSYILQSLFFFNDSSFILQRLFVDSSYTLQRFVADPSFNSWECLTFLFLQLKMRETWVLIKWKGY